VKCELEDKIHHDISFEHFAISFFDLCDPEK
jgi:hypothetical protein